MYVIIADKCINCGICTDSCPIGVIRTNGLQFFIVPDECTGCRICVNSCPLGAIQAQAKETP